MEINFSENFIIRVPRYSLELLEKVKFGMQENPLMTLQENIGPDLADFVMLSSKGLADEIKAADGTLNEKKIKTLYKYIVRAASRATPYGAYSLVGIGKKGKTFKISFTENDIKRYNCLDGRLLLLIYKKALVQCTDDVIVFTNPTLYNVGNKLCYYELILKEYNDLDYKLSAVVSNVIIKYIVKIAAFGLPLKEIADRIREKFSLEDLHKEEVAAYVKSLVHCNLLISEFYSSLTAADPLQAFVKSGTALPENFRSSLHEIQLLLKKKIDYSALDRMSQLLSLNTYESQNIFLSDHTVTFKHNELDGKMIEQVEQSLKRLMTLMEYNNAPMLTDFKKRFVERYGSKLVSFVEALDPQVGVGYDNMLSNRNYVKDSLLKLLPTNNLKQSSRISESFNWKLEKIIEAYKNNKLEIEIEDKDLNQLGEGNNSFPEFFYTLGSLYMNDFVDSLPSESLVYQLAFISGASSVCSFSRFANGNKDMLNLIKRQMEREDEVYKDAIVAEVLCVSEAKALNVIPKVPLRNYCIVFQDIVHEAGSKVIPLNDLLITVKNDVILLYSKKLNKRVIPRLSHSFNFRISSLLPYRFLADLQMYNVNAGLIWNWEELGKIDFLPRLRYKNIIVSRATWNLTFIECSKFGISKPTKGSFSKDDLNNFNNYLKDKRIPNKVAIISGDNELNLNLEYEFDVKLLLEELSKKTNLVIKEYFFNTKNSVIKSSGGSFNNEIVIMGECAHSLSRYKNIKTATAADNVELYEPGSDWIYFKIYGSIENLEEVLRCRLPKVLNFLKRNNLVKKFFFIRYEDTEQHLRLRLLLADKENFAKVVSVLGLKIKKWISKKIVWHFTIDTYIRETERYKDIDVAETIFYYDSIAVLNLISLIGSDERSERWLCAIFGTDRLLDSFYFSLQEKAYFIKGMANAFEREFKGKITKRQLDEAYRSFKPEIEEAFKGPKTEIDKRMVRIIKSRDAGIKKELKNSYLEKKIKSDSEVRNEVVGSFVHMYINRLFKSEQRKAEYAVYYFLDKFYYSKLNRLKICQ